LIHFKTVGHALGQFILALSAVLLLLLVYAVIVRDDGVGPFAAAMAASTVVGLALIRWSGRPTRNIGTREALLLVVSVWISISLLGAIPFYLSPHFSGFTDAFFESASGFTTTGATILARVEVLPNSIQLWRHFTHWLGGMGVVLLGIAVLPLVGHGGMQLYRAEFSGARSEKLTPRIRETALALWKVYVGLTLAQIIALRLAGMTTFEAACHAFSTLGTGGFSTLTSSVAGFNSPLIEYIIVIFMLLAGVSFVQHYRLWIERRAKPVLSDFEVRAYFGLAALSTVVVGITLMLTGTGGVERAFRDALFQVTSIMTTTGFMTSDFELWHPLPQLILLMLMFAGGSTGSTAGGLKTARVVLLRQVVNREFRRMAERRGVFAVRLGGRVVPEDTVRTLLNFVYLALLVNFAACMLLAAFGIDVLTAITAVAACMFNVGPGLGGVGPADNYGHLPAAVKWILSACMMAGRLEFYTLLVIFTPAFWRK
jgi:trk system potassium uptake protein TrkH